MVGAIGSFARLVPFHLVGGSGLHDAPHAVTRDIELSPEDVSGGRRQLCLRASRGVCEVNDHWSCPRRRAALGGLKRCPAFFEPKPEELIQCSIGDLEFAAVAARDDESVEVLGEASSGGCTNRALHVPLNAAAPLEFHDQWSATLHTKHRNTQAAHFADRTSQARASRACEALFAGPHSERELRPARHVSLQSRSGQQGVWRWQ